MEPVEECRVGQRGSRPHDDLRPEEDQGRDGAEADAGATSPTPDRGRKEVHDENPNQQHSASMQHREYVGAAEVRGEPAATERPGMTALIRAAADDSRPREQENESGSRRQA